MAKDEEYLMIMANNILLNVYKSLEGIYPSDVTRQYYARLYAIKAILDHCICDNCIKKAYYVDGLNYKKFENLIKETYEHIRTKNN